VGALQLQKPHHLGRALALRAEYGLSYFDSPHAIAAMSTGATLVSFDKRYAGIKGVSIPACERAAGGAGGLLSYP